MVEQKNEENDDSAGLHTVTITMEIIEELQASNGASVIELQNRLDLSKSGIYNHLNTLQEYDLIVKQDDQYKLSLMFTLFGEYTREQDKLYSVGREAIEELSAELGHTVHLVTEENLHRIEISTVMGEMSIGSQFSSVYDRLNFHSTASGKAILAYTDEETRESILNKHDLFERTPNTITERSTLEEELDKIRDQGYSINDEEEMGGLRGVGAPIKGQGGAIEGAVSISAPTGRVTNECLHQDWSEKAIQTANVIQLNLIMATRAER